MCLCVDKGARQGAASGEAGQPRTAASPCKSEGGKLACRSRTRTASQCRGRSRASPWFLPFGREQRQEQIRCVWPPAQIASLQDGEVARLANSVLFALAGLSMRGETQVERTGPRCGTGVNLPSLWTVVPACQALHAIARTVGHTGSLGLHCLAVQACVATAAPQADDVLAACQRCLCKAASGRGCRHAGTAA